MTSAESQPCPDCARHEANECQTCKGFGRLPVPQAFTASVKLRAVVLMLKAGVPDCGRAQCQDCKSLNRDVAEALRGLDRLFELAMREWHSASATELTRLKTPHPRDDWHEDFGSVVWWRLPVTEPPYVGTPLDDDFPEYVTHWTPLIVVDQPKEAVRG